MKTPIVFVSINYRLGLFGFLAGAAIERAGLTNNGYRDQRLALEWIQENIAAFGGDPGRVTIFGESAGATGVAAQIVAFGGDNKEEEGGRRLFHGAVMQSGTMGTGQPYLNAERREEVFQGILNNTACAGKEDVVKCLQHVPISALAKANLTQSSLFTVHDDFFPELPSTLLAQGRFAHVPVILGTNRNEGTTIPLTAPINTVQDFTVAVLTVRGYPASVAQKLWHLYGNEVDNPSVAGLGSVSRTQGPELGQEFSRASLWIGDDYFTFSRRLYNEIWAKACVPSYSYFFDVPPADAFLNTSIYGVPHFAEIPYVFANSEAVGWETNPIRQGDDDKDRYNKVVDLMSRMWVSFAVHGSPNKHGLPDVDDWPEYSRDNPTNMWFKLSSFTTQPDDWRTKAMDVYREISVGILW
ncbi:PnbA Carboxylesterase type B [Pyrenophora tritici-repentis]|nr:PnbA Carboxylesterase type B [Pyrenophora tritici-repentis]